MHLQHDGVFLRELWPQPEQEATEHAQRGLPGAAEAHLRGDPAPMVQSHVQDPHAATEGED